MLEVEMEVGANPNKYWAFVRFRDKNGKVHERAVEEENKGTVHSNYLRAMIEGYRILIKPCMVTVYCGSDHITACFQQGWVSSWENHEWKNSNGRDVRNVELWKQLRRFMAPHSTRVIYKKGE